MYFKIRLLQFYEGGIVRSKGNGLVACFGGDGGCLFYITVVDDYQLFACRIVCTLGIEVVGDVLAGYSLAACVADQLIQHTGVEQVYFEGSQVDSLTPCLKLFNVTRG